MESGRRIAREAVTVRGAVVLFALAGLLATAACKGGDSASGQNRARADARRVKTVAVTQIPVGKSVSVSGTLLAFDQAVVSTKIPGRIASVTVDLGSVVQKGQVIARLEDRDYRLKVDQASASLAQARARLGLALDGSDDRVDATKTSTVRQAQATLDQAQQTLDRATTLVKEGIVPRSEYDAAVAAQKVAAGQYQDAVEEIRNRQGVLAQRRSELDIAKQQLVDTVIYAAFSGRVEEKRASIGEYVGAGTPLVNLVRVDPLRFRAEVPERDSSEIHEGQNVRVTIEGAPNAYSGRITRISPAISQQNRVLVIEADVANDGTLRPGSFAHGDIVTDDTQQAVTIPPNALVVFAGIEKVIVIKDGKAVEKPITTGRRGDGWIEILAGVNVGEQVIVDPGNLQTGNPVSAE
jgi:RND family efflux transporter MFP subunit